MNNDINEHVTQLNNIISNLRTMEQYNTNVNNINNLLFQIRGQFGEYTGEQLAPSIVHLYNHIPVEPNINYIHQLWTEIQNINEENWEEPDSQGSGLQYIGPDDFFVENYGTGLKGKSKSRRSKRSKSRKSKRSKRSKRSRRSKKSRRSRKSRKY